MVLPNNVMTLRAVMGLALMAAFLLACSGSPEPSAPRGPRVGVAQYMLSNVTMSCDWLAVYDDSEELLLSFLWETPGPSKECLLRWFDDPRPKTLLIHLSNGVCRRKGNCPQNEPFEDEILDKALEATAWVDAFCPDCALILSPQLEDNWSDREACYYGEGIKLVSGAHTSRNPVKASQLGACPYFDYVELHNERAFPPGKPCIYSNDGRDLLVGNTVWDLPQRISRDELAADIRALPDCLHFVWAADGNCLTGDTSRAPLPAERVCGNDPGTIADLSQFLGSFT